MNARLLLNKYCKHGLLVNKYFYIMNNRKTNKISPGSEFGQYKSHPLGNLVLY